MPESDTLKRIERKLDLLLREKRKEEKAEKWLSEKEAAAMLSLSVRYFRRQVKDGELPIRYKERKGRHFTYSLQSIQSFLNQSIYS